MPTFNVTILPGPPDIQVTMAGGISYEEFNNMLGPLNLIVKRFFLESSDGVGLTTNLNYSIFDASGPQLADVVKPRKNPYQRQNSLEVSPIGFAPPLLNGLSNVNLTLQPGQLLTITLELDEISAATIAPGRLHDNFLSVPDTLGNFERFKKQLRR